MIKLEYDSATIDLLILIYVRKSKKLDKGITFETQVDRCKREAKKKFGENVKIKIFIEENKSGDDVSREKYNEMKELIKLHNNCIVFSYAVNRLVRDVAEGENLAKFLTKENCQLYIYDIGRMHIETPEGRSFFLSQCNNAETELNRVKKNQAENAFKKGSMSIKTGCQAAYGYEHKSEEIFEGEKIFNKSSYTIKESEIVIVMRIYDLYLKYKSISKVTKILREDDVRGKNGELISKATIASVLKNPVNVKTNQQVVDYFLNKGFVIGKIEFGKGGNRYGVNSKAEFIDEENRKKYFFTLDHNGVIDPEIWLKTQHILDEKSINKITKKGKSKKSSLDNLLKCKCGADMKIASIKGETVYYCCTNKCGRKNVNGNKLEKMIFEDVVNINKDALVNQMNKNYKKVVKKLDVRLSELVKRRSYLMKSYNKLREKIIFLEMKKEARIQYLNKDAEDKYKSIQELNEKIYSIESNMSNIYDSVKGYIELFKSKEIDDILFEEADIEIRKSILKMMFKEIIWDADTEMVYINKNK